MVQLHRLVGRMATLRFQSVNLLWKPSLGISRTRSSTMSVLITRMKCVCSFASMVLNGMNDMCGGEVEQAFSLRVIYLHRYPGVAACGLHPRLQTIEPFGLKMPGSKKIARVTNNESHMKTSRARGQAVLIPLVHEHGSLFSTEKSYSAQSINLRALVWRAVRARGFQGGLGHRSKTGSPACQL